MIEANVSFNQFLLVRYILYAVWRKNFKTLLAIFIILKLPSSQQFSSDICFFITMIFLSLSRFFKCITQYSGFIYHCFAILFFKKFCANCNYIICSDNQCVHSLFQRNDPWWKTNSSFWIHVKGNITNYKKEKQNFLSLSFGICISYSMNILQTCH